jgi:hypothetical protein
MIPNVIPEEVIQNEDQGALDAIAEELDFELDHRKSFANQVSDVRNRASYVAREKERKKAEALLDPRNWKFKEGFKLAKYWGPNPNGGIYLQNTETSLQFFVPAGEAKQYLAD